jgi:hypothetical protein
VEMASVILYSSMIFFFTPASQMLPERSLSVLWHVFSHILTVTVKEEVTFFLRIQDCKE